MWSMAEYKQRAPDWHGALTVAEIPDLVHRNLAALIALIERRDGLVIDYSQIRSGSPRLHRLAGLLAPTESADAHEDWIANSLARTERRQLTAETTFVGEHASRSAIGPDGCWSEMRTLIDESDAMHAELIRGNQ